MNVPYCSKKSSYKVVVKLPDLKRNSNGLIIFHKTLLCKVSWTSLNSSSKLFETIMTKEGKGKVHHTTGHEGPKGE
jgi:hypothetical protein